MSYRAFKRLLGETSLERRCRFLFGALILVLITTSFGLFARQTEHLAYKQLTTTCRLLVNQIVDRQIATRCRSSSAPRGKASQPSDEDQRKIAQAILEFQEKWEERWPAAVKDYRFWTVKADPARQEGMPDPATLER